MPAQQLTQHARVAGSCVVTVMKWKVLMDAQSDLTLVNQGLIEVLAELDSCNSSDGLGTDQLAASLASHKPAPWWGAGLRLAWWCTACRLALTTT